MHKHSESPSKRAAQLLWVTACFVVKAHCTGGGKPSIFYLVCLGQLQPAFWEQLKKTREVT